MLQITNPKKFILVIIILLGLLAWGAFGFVVGKGQILKSGEFTIAPGASAATVWKDLGAQGFSNRQLPWKYQAWRQKAAGKLKAGTYQLQAGENIAGVISRFASGDTTPDELTITYPEGFTLEQIAERTAEKGIGTKEEFIAAANPKDFADQYPYLAQLGSDRTLEGYLFPDTYRVFPDDTPHDVIARMLANFDKKLTDDLRAEALADHRTIDQIVTMASIVEREVTSDQDMALVAGVLWKRFDDNAGLAADATLRYALHKPVEDITAQDLATDSPYNTRKYRGLPPSPISNPGLRALLAAVRPEASDYYYYLSAPDGQTIFSKTLNEHNANKAKYLR